MKAKDTVMNIKERIDIGTHKGASMYAWGSEEIQKLLERQAEISFKAGEEAKGTEIGEAICILVGNTMLEHMGDGKRLSEKLEPIMEICKGKNWRTR